MRLLEEKRESLCNKYQIHKDMMKYIQFSYNDTSVNGFIFTQNEPNFSKRQTTLEQILSIIDTSLIKVSHKSISSSMWILKLRKR